MRTHALLKENTVVDIIGVTDQEHYQLLMRTYQLVVDIHDLVVQPQIGWILSGSTLVPPPGQVIDFKQMIEAKLKYYQSVAGDLLRGLYADNTLMGITNAQSDQMFEEYTDVLLRIREGAFPTALYRLSQKTPSGFVTQEMIDAWSARVSAYLN